MRWPFGAVPAGWRCGRSRRRGGFGGGFGGGGGGAARCRPSYCTLRDRPARNLIDDKRIKKTRLSISSYAVCSIDCNLHDRTHISVLLCERSRTFVNSATLDEVEATATAVALTFRDVFFYNCNSDIDCKSRKCKT